MNRRTWRNKLYSAYDAACIRIGMLWSTLRARCSLAFQGCRCGPGFRSTGAIRVKAREDGSISIGKGVVLLAGWRSNRVGLSGPVILHTWEGGNIHIGDFTGASSVVISSRCSIRIGRHCTIGGNVRIFDHDFHSLDAMERRVDGGCQQAACRPVQIGDDVFLGAGCMILKGTEIGDRVIVGAGAVVSGNFPPDTVVAGNPARVIRPAPSARR